MGSSLIEKIIAGRWIAGGNIADAIRVSENFNKRRISTIINYLGEEFTSAKDVSETVDTYFALIDSIAKANVRAAISIKPTQLGLRISKTMASSNYAKILKYAESRKIFVWLDMETSKDVTFTIDTYMKMLRNGNSGICIQAYLKRSREDITKIAKAGGIVRLVKGAYSESEKIAYKRKEDIDKNYIALLHYLFRASHRFTVATHDLRMIEESLRLNRKYKRHVTYAMLNGIRNKKAVELARREDVAIYVPFGSRWVDYAYRRMREAGHMNIIIKSLLESQKI